MSHNKTELFLHLAWATWDRVPLITPEIEEQLHRCIQAEARSVGCAVLAINGMPDHIHLLVQFPAVLAVAGLVKQVKGASSHLVNHALRTDSLFKWQGSYGAFSLSKSEIPIVAAYIQNQKQHHHAGRASPEWEI